MLKYFRPITHKKGASEDKDPPEGKELSNLSWPYLSKVSYTPIVIVITELLATCIMLT